MRDTSLGAPTRPDAASRKASDNRLFHYLLRTGLAFGACRVRNYSFRPAQETVSSSASLARMIEAPPVCRDGQE